MPKKVTTNRHPSKRSTGPLPYVPCRHLLTPGERRFYHSGLLPAVGSRWIIALKVRLADVITAENFHTPHGRRIAQKHLDFVLLTPKTTRIVAAVELNDATHNQPKRKTRDAFLADALHAARVPLITFPIYRQYNPKIIRHHLQTNIKPRKN